MSIVMKPLVSIKETIGTEKWVTISMLRPLLHKLIHMHLAETSGDSRIERSLTTAILSDFQYRYVGESLIFLTKAAFLDPRFKMLSFINTNEREEVVKEIKEEAAELAESMAAEDNTNGTLTSNQGVVKQSKGEHKLMKLLSDVVQGSSSTEDGQLCITPYQKASMEVSQYSGEVLWLLASIHW